MFYTENFVVSTSPEEKHVLCSNIFTHEYSQTICDAETLKYTSNNPDPTFAKLNMETGEVHTANFPEDYKSDSQCSWLITVSQGSSVGLQFQSFKVYK